MRVLVTGAAGYLGRAVVSALAAEHEPIALVHRPSAPIAGAAEIHVADLLDPAALRRAMTGVQAVCHLAGLGNARESLADPLAYFRVNTAGTTALLEAMAAERVEHLVFASTAAIYATATHKPLDESAPDAPAHPYASSKLAAEWAAEAQARTGALAATILRLMNVTGGHDPNPTRLIPRTLAAAAGAGTLEINGDGTTQRDYLHVDDAAHAFRAALQHAPEPGTARRYNIGSGCGTSILDLVAAAERVTGRPVPLVHKPAAPEPAVLIADSAKARTELGWLPTRSAVDDLVGDTWSRMNRPSA
ncbi:NAD-dependent epimerase/dehydratase family protein [Nocardia huaxiensis]|uniref:NAD-dependent epimerase/dehydratase family protein n=1 Tax=Nocardia huaxiensis TaxID=2755382 RepID=UPI001E378699|nr:NAD-dependent epimerase/dehydratase family protein [Nocardia huaxiensis]UFS98118.1 NAD-dependent epimerase/dehydratase family protein [Nocardia huaxiensis]